MGRKIGTSTSKFIFEKMEKEGISSIVELSRRSGVGQPALSGLINSRISSRTKKGDWRKEVLSLATFFECSPGALFGIEEDSCACDDSRVQAEACFSHTRSNVLSAYAEALDPERSVFRGELAQRQEDILMGLTTQEKRSVILCFGFDGMGERTLAEAGKELNISHTRVGQLRNNAIEKLQRKIKLKALYAGE